MAGDFEARLKTALDDHRPERVPVKDARDAAVLIPVVGTAEPRLIFTVRTDTLPSHKGQISFPGGSIDARDSSPRATALREAEEELGIGSADVRVLGELDSVPTFVSGYVVTPVVGWLDKPPLLRPNPGEVAAVLEVPVVELAEEIRSEPGFSHGGRTYPTEAWIWNDNVIWGVTARIVRLFLYRLAEAALAPPPADTISPWPATRTSP